MDDVNKYLKTVKDAVIKPSDSIEEKIIDRISHIDEKDKELLDDKYLDYFKKTNSRVYMLSEKIRNNPGGFAVTALAVSLILLFVAYILKVFFSEENSRGRKNNLSSPEGKNQYEQED